MFLIYGVLFYIGICAAVVLLSNIFNSHVPSETPIPDYDNRWWGYPNVPGDPYYNGDTKGKFGNLPEVNRQNENR